MGVHLHPTFVLANRRAIEDEIERLIGLLDLVDGDCDLEDDDPAGDPLDEHGEAPSHDGYELVATRPVYGLDQSLGPINYREAERGYRARELGLARTPGGGWKKPS
ncbi:hypothetical protein NED98_05680 [Sphingomonas sp. MMSM20]|uniref:hypothetical protein n=1 Tax=Sphingomonas lycopersici TaxID=2951807 RepID=UPI0022374BC7|nr:hypothetical protein [Sphingomonas lycopersici]MCW6529730.1 hypothetical protein [Sphingomonas lycopersici]